MQNRCEEMTDSLVAWIERHGKDFVAHAIWENNVEKLLKAGMVHSAEAIVRSGKTASFETGTWGDRSSLNLGFYLEELKKNPVDDIPCPLIYQNAMSLGEAITKRYIRPAQVLSFMSVTEMSKYLYGNEAILEWLELMNRQDEIKRPLSKEQFANMNEEEKQKFRVILHDGKDYDIVLEPEKEGDAEPIFKIQGIPSIRINNSYELALLSDFCNKKKIPNVRNFQLARDVQSSLPVDKMLALIWQAFLKLNPYSQSQIKIDTCKDLCTFRKRAIKCSALSYEIRVAYNAVYWQYGKVAVLRGNPKDIISALKNTYDTEKKELSHKIDTTGSEVYLLQPFENGGEPFALDLSNEDTIVLGPEEILSPYRGLANSKGIRFHSFESMTQEQLNFFSVPPSFYATNKNEDSKESHRPSAVGSNWTPRLMDNNKKESAGKKQADLGYFSTKKI